MANNDVFKGFLIGAAVVALAPLVLTALSGNRSSVGRGLARAGGVLANKARETAAELAEVVEDTAAELQAPDNFHEPETPPDSSSDGPETSGSVSGGAA